MNNATIIDLRSDTVTRPDAEMRRAMAEAEVGDDVFQEDPTVRRLEEQAAERLGTEAALFVPSGTMGNQIALHLHGARGAEVVGEASSHVFLYEMGAMAALSGLMPKPVASERGLLDPARVEAAINPDAPYRSRTRLLVVENTHNMTGGRVSDRARLDALLEVARRRGLRTHLDGARLFNAAVALGVEAKVLAAGFDSVTFCLSKGLGAPVGSVLCGRREWIAEAWRVRKMFGGGMRQVGVLAAAGLVALRSGPEHLRRDHENAAVLARGLAEIRGLTVDLEGLETNIVIFGVDGELWGDAPGFCSRLRERGVLCLPVSPVAVRMVTHRDVGRDQIERALGIVRQLA